ncbi:DUF397 domain-containing protein [Streptomyces sp. NPDC048416]|uniref:DUF397 domain-containing protein n=1 Tax=Streptomyces sp. NPDC048416 TaxID=3365546 RepID=UPI003724BD9C
MRSAGECREVALNTPGTAAVQESESFGGAMLRLTPAAWAAFTAGGVGGAGVVGGGGCGGDPHS